jgi:hypothetical protein
MTTYQELNKSLTFDEVSIKDQIHRFGVEALRPAAMELDPLPPEEVIAPGSVFWEVSRKAYQLGLHSSDGRSPWAAWRCHRWLGTSTARKWAGPAPISPSGSAFRRFRIASVP